MTLFFMKSLQYFLVHSVIFAAVKGLYSGAKLRDVQHPWKEVRCPPCNIHECVVVMPEKCNGRVVRDQCDCCPMCNQTSIVFPSPATTENAFDWAQSEDTEDPEACSKIQCPKKKICLLNIQGIPVCRCPSSIYCREKPRKEVCSTEGKTYRSLCTLKMEACVSDKKIEVEHRGPCEKEQLYREERKRMKEEKKNKRLEKQRVKMERKSERHDRDWIKLEKRRKKKDRKSDDSRKRKNVNGRDVSKERREELREERKRHRRRLNKIMKRKKLN